jgi:hypothetical protein
MADDDQLVQELRTLRRGHGLMAVKLQYAPALLGALGTDDPTAAYEKFLALMADLSEGPATEALRTAYGIGGIGGPTLEVRRYRLAERMVATPEQLQHYEDAAILELVNRVTRSSASGG